MNPPSPNFGKVQSSGDRQGSNLRQIQSGDHHYHPKHLRSGSQGPLSCCGQDPLNIRPQVEKSPTSSRWVDVRYRMHLLS